MHAHGGKWGAVGLYEGECAVVDGDAQAESAGVDEPEGGAVDME